MCSIVLCVLNVCKPQEYPGFLRSYVNRKMELIIIFFFKLDQIWFHSIEWFRRRFLKISNFSMDHSPWQPSWMYGKVTGHNFGKGHTKKYYIKHWYHYDQWVLRRRSKCEKLSDDKQQTQDAKWWEKLMWAFGSGQLKKWKINCVLPVLHFSNMIQSLYQQYYHNVQWCFCKTWS